MHPPTAEELKKAEELVGDEPEAQSEATAADKPKLTKEEKAAAKAERKKRRNRGLRHLWSYTKHFRGRLSVAMLLAVISAGLGLLQPLIMRELVSRVEMLGQFNSSVAWALAALIVVAIVSAIASGVQIYLLGTLGEGVVANARIGLAKAMLRLPLNRYATLSGGEAVSRVSSDTTLIRQAISTAAVSGLAALVMSIGATTALLFIDWVTFLVAITGALGALLVTVLVSIPLRKANMEMQEKLAHLSTRIGRDVTAVRLIRAYGSQRGSEEAMVAGVRSVQDVGIRVAKLMAWVNPISSMLLTLSMIMAIGVGGIRMATGALSIGDMVAFLMFFTMLLPPLVQLGSMIIQVQQALAGIERIEQIVPDERELGAPETPKGLFDAAVDIDVTDVQVGYDEKVVLEHITMNLPAGRRIGLVGPSGAGKTTLLHAIAGLGTPLKGQITVGGQDIAAMNLLDYRRSVGLVDQQSLVLPTTLRENLELADEALSDEQMWAALEQVGLREDLETREGLDTTLGENGLSLSGGQRQRLSLARAMLRSPAVLLLDEPTASLDAQSEANLLTALDQLAGQTTVVMVAHRLSTVVDADRIIVIDEGGVSAEGTHDELLVSSPWYARMARIQHIV